MSKKNQTTSFDSFIAQALNDSQREAVMHKSGSMLVVAGAGSGKTRVITSRITYLMVHEQVQPEQILALTFTNKAALEMKQRVAHFLPAGSRLPFVGTFHAYCVRILKQHHDKISHQFAAILDPDDQQIIIKQILQRAGLHKKFTAKQIQHRISHIKNHYLDPQKAFAEMNQPLIRDIYYAYEHEKQLSRCCDFDDLLQYAVKLYSDAACAEQFRSVVRHILVDEYQDTNIIQHALLKVLCLDKKKLAIDSLCVVGDEDQSIYSWRGATVQNIQDFVRDFSHTRVIKIEQNYRSVQGILDVANAVITHNSGRMGKTLWSAKKSPQRVYSLSFSSEYQEADVVAQLLLTLHKRQQLSSIAILYRSHTQSRALEEACIKAAVPYTIIGAVQFYDRMEIKDMLAYLRLIANPFDRVSYARVINVPARKLGAKCEELMLEAWAKDPFLSFIQLGQQLVDRGELTGARAVALSTFLLIFDELSPKMLPSEALEAILMRVRYKSYLQESYEREEADERISNVDELLNAFKHFEQNGISTLAQALEEITLVQDHSTHTDSGHNAVILMTLHAAKGLEFDTVILTGLEEGLLPTSRAMTSESIEEERRLLYVGITRACERLLLTRAKCRYTYGSMTTQFSSRFSSEIPAKLVTHHDVSIWHMREIHALLVEWFGIQDMQTTDSKSSKIRQQTY